LQSGESLETHAESFQIAYGDNSEGNSSGSDGPPAGDLPEADTSTIEEGEEEVTEWGEEEDNKVVDNEEDNGE